MPGAIFIEEKAKKEEGRLGEVVDILLGRGAEEDEIDEDFEDFEDLDEADKDDEF